jgi:unsaturated chondroitin disaccharide hydrolase
VNEKLISGATGLSEKIDRFWKLSGKKIKAIENDYDFSKGSPVFTWDGKYTTRGWTEWTEGFVYGSAILQFDATGDEEFLRIGRDRTVSRMAKHVTHTGVHDHGFNNVSTYGNLLRLAVEGRIDASEWEREYYRMALEASGAVQAARWTTTEDGGYVYSFNGPHSLFADTIRSLRSLAVAHLLGHELLGEHDEAFSLLERLLIHAETTAKYVVYHGEGRDAYDLPGRTVHEAIFNLNDGKFRCPSTQQGYSPFSTWTRGLAWIITGFAEELEFIDALEENERNTAVFAAFGGKQKIVDRFLSVAKMCADFHIANSCTDGVPYWDTGAPGLDKLGDWRSRASEPYNEFEPVDSSAAAITAQGMLRIGEYLAGRGDTEAETHSRAGITILDTLLSEPYISGDDDHQGLLLHSVYHRPNGWDRIPEGRSVPSGESCMWGDYHVREAVLLLERLMKQKPYYAFWRLT